MFSKPVNDTIKITLTILAILATGWLVFFLRDILLLLFVAYIIASALLPLVNSLSKFGAPRWLTVLFVYVVFCAVIGVVLWGFIPVLAIQVSAFFESLPAIFNQVVSIFRVEDLIKNVDVRTMLPEIFQTFSNEILATPTSLIGVFFGIFSSFANVFILLVFSYYILLEHDRFRRHLLVLFGKEERKTVTDILERVEHKLGAWLRGQLVIMMVTGVITFVGLSVLQIKFSVSLAIITGLFEIIPIFGPIIAFVPALMVALTQSVWHALGVFVLYMLIQQISGVTLVPKVMNKAVGIDPLIIILAIMIGGRLAGTVGILLAIPSAAILAIFWEEFLERRS